MMIPMIKFDISLTKDYEILFQREYLNVLSKTKYDPWKKNQ